MQGTRSITTLSEHACFGGVQGFYQHDSDETGTPMKFGVFTPPQAKQGAVPVLFYLAGLTCNAEKAELRVAVSLAERETGSARRPKLGRMIFPD